MTFQRKCHFSNSTIDPHNDIIYFLKSAMKLRHLTFSFFKAPYICSGTKMETLISYSYQLSSPKNNFVKCRISQVTFGKEGNLFSEFNHLKKVEIVIHLFPHGSTLLSTNIINYRK